MDYIFGKWEFKLPNELKLKILFNEKNKFTILNNNQIKTNNTCYFEKGYYFIHFDISGNNNDTHCKYYRFYIKSQYFLNIIYNNDILNARRISYYNPKPKIAYITAIYGPYEATCKKFAKQTIHSDFICFTNVSSIVKNNWIIDNTEYHYFKKSNVDTDIYRNSLKNNNHTFNIAKYYKQQHYNIPRLEEYDIVVWLDGTIEITNEKTSEYVLDKINKNNLIVTGLHGRTIHNKMQLEMIDSNFERYTSTYWFNQSQPYQDIFKQYADYLEDGYSEDYWKEVSDNNQYGLWITCFLAIDMRSNKAIEFMDKWYLETLRHTTQDQISFPYVCQKMKIHPYSYPDDEISGITHEETSIYKKHNHRT